MISFLFFVSSLLLLLLLFFLLFLLFPYPAYSAVGTQAPRPPFSRHIIRLFPIRPVCISLCVSVCVCVCVYSFSNGRGTNSPAASFRFQMAASCVTRNIHKKESAIDINQLTHSTRKMQQTKHTHTHTHTHNNDDYYSNFDDIDNGL